MNISLTCCVSLVGFDWGPNPSLRCMNVGLNIHQMLSQKLYPLLSTTHKGTNRPPPYKAKKSRKELNFSPGLTCCLPELFQLLCASVWGLCWIRMGVSTGQSLTSRTSTCPVVIACRFLVSLPTLRGPHPLLFTHSECGCSCLQDSCEEAHRDVFDAWFIIHVWTIQSLRHLPGEGCCSTLLSAHN